jgi:hypothetical protein
MSGSEMFYTQNNKKQDSELHNPILLNGADNLKDILDRANRLGLSNVEIELMFPAAFSEKKQ